MAIICPVRFPITSPVSFAAGRSAPVGSFPPVFDKLLVWLRGQNLSDYQKRDFKSGYMFLFQNCPHDYILDQDGNPELDVNGNPIWITDITEGWECEYLAPKVGESGHDELVVVDPGYVLYDSFGEPIANDKDALYAISNDNMWFCEDVNKGFLVYDLTLTPEEITEIEEWIINGCSSG